MERKIILYIAMTLDGFIADSHDGLSFLDAYNDYPEVQTSINNLMLEVDTLLMGRRTYDIVNQMSDSWAYPNHMTYVFTSKDEKDKENIKFTSERIEPFVSKLKNMSGKDIWLVGGGRLIQPFIEKNLIDEYRITIIPKLLGRGIKLFHDQMNMLSLKYERTDYFKDLVMLTYSKIV
jgi:dihydrofolate reductase